MSSSENIDALVERAFAKRFDHLADIIESENLYEYELGFRDIVYADEVNYAIVPCEYYMILAHEHIDRESNKPSAEYAIYSQHDRDGRNLHNSLNMNSVYELEFLGEEEFTNMAYAIAYAADLIRKITGKEML